MAVIEREARIVNPLGMHVRPGAEFVKIANRLGRPIFALDRERLWLDFFLPAGAAGEA